MHKLIPLQDQPGMPEMIANVISAARGKVCEVCGLELMGHGPESRWLGFDRHPWAGVPATAEMLEQAGALTLQAYRNRP